MSLSKRHFFPQDYELLDSIIAQQKQDKDDDMIEITIERKN